MSASAILALAFVTAAPTAPSAAPDPKLVELVRRLGDKSYRAREDAARELLRRGSESVAALNEGTKDADPEVSERCKQLLPQAASLERNENLAKLVKDLKSPPPKGLAGVEQFLKITGDGKEARELYAELLAIHYRTLETAEEDPRKAGEQFRQFCDDTYNRWQAGARVGRYSYDNLFATRADITFFLFMLADSRVRKVGTGRSSVFWNGTQISKAISEGDTSKPMQKLFLNCLESESQGYTKAQMLVYLVKVGSKEHIPTLEKFLSDKSVIGNVGFGNGQQMSVQMRDVAMGVSALLAGQKLSDFGFDNRFGGGTPSSYIYFGFSVEADGKESKAREEAHAKWKEWASKNLPQPKK